MDLDTTIHACGTYEEITTVNREKKPVLIYCEQGIGGIPDWLFGVLPYQFFFNTWEDMKRYLYHIHTAAEEDIESYKRWMFFDYTRMMPQVTPEESEQVTLLC